MRLNKLILIVLSVFFILSAEETYKVDIDSKGIKTFYNKKPADPDFKIELTKIGKISSGQLDSLEAYKFMVYDFDFDKDGNSIILDHNRMWKFSREGKFIKNWSRQGYGPGEIVNPFNFCLVNDTIYLSNGVPPKIMKFDTEGNFIEDINPYYRTYYPDDIFFGCNDFFLGAVGVYKDKEEINTEYIVRYDNKSFDAEKVIFKREYKKTPKDWFAGVNDFIYAGDERVFFVVDNSFNEYKIDCFDSQNGKLKYKIRKNHIRVKSDKKEEIHYGFYNGEKIAMKTGTSQFEEAINMIYYDKFDRLWVNSNHRENGEDRSAMYFDIFKDGIFLNRIKLDTEFSYIYAFKLEGDKIVEYGGDNNVYFYEFK